MKYFHKKALITEKKQLTADIFLLRFEAPRISAAAQPGQFVHVEAPGRCLRRAFSVFSADEATVSIIFRVIGRGTRLIAALDEGERLDVIGPLGNGFPKPEGKPLFVAGGLGAAPLSFMASGTEKGLFVYGVTKECDFIPGSILGTSGHRVLNVCQEKTGELVTDLIEHNLSGIGTVYAAGPRIMLRVLAGICRGRVRAYVSWEEAMGCGTGLCQGCPVKTATGYRMTCSDGPVFNAEEIDFNAC